mgnify:CR=1 FL=1
MTEVEQIKSIVKDMLIRYPGTPPYNMMDTRADSFIGEVQSVGLDRAIRALKFWGSTERKMPDPIDIKAIAKDKYPLEFENEDSLYNRCKHAWLRMYVIDEQKEPEKLKYAKLNHMSYSPMRLAWIGFFQHITQSERDRFNTMRQSMKLTPFREYKNLELPQYYYDTEGSAKNPKKLAGNALRQPVQEEQEVPF